MRKMAYVTADELPDIVKVLAAADVPDIYITDDRGGTGCFIVVAQSSFLPALHTIPWENVPQFDSYNLGDMPEDE